MQCGHRPRTNATVFDKAVQLIKTRTLGFVGGVQSYRLNGLKDVYYLQAGKYVMPISKALPITAI